ncbi:MAG: TolC family protein [Vicinamibacteria bacterium]
MRRTCFLGFVALTIARLASADTVDEASFLAALDGAHPALRALGGELARADAARRRAGTLGNPRLEFWRERPAGSPTLTNWTLAWTPPLDGRFGLGKRAAEAGVAVARETLAIDAAALRRELRRVFADWSLAHARSRILADHLERAAALAEQERQRARVGTESGLAARRLTLAEAEARAALRSAEAESARAAAAARAWQPGLGREAAPVVPELPPAPPNPTTSAVPSVRRAERQLEQARLEARLAGRYWGFPTLQAGVQRLESGGLVESGPILGAAWSIPLFDRNQGARIEGQRQVEIAEARSAQAQALAASQIQGGLDAYRALRLAVGEALQASAETGRVIAAATAAYRAGETSLTDLLDALRSALETRLRELDLRAEALATHRDLEAVLGRPLTDGGVR